MDNKQKEEFILSLNESIKELSRHLHTAKENSLAVTLSIERKNVNTTDIVENIELESITENAVVFKKEIKKSINPTWG